MSTQQIDRIHNVCTVRRELQTMIRGVRHVESSLSNLHLAKHPLTTKGSTVRGGVRSHCSPTVGSIRFDFQLTGDRHGVLVHHRNRDYFLE